MKPEEISKRLTEFRKSQHINVKTLCEKIHMEEGTLGAQLLGKRNISLSTIEKIVLAYPALSIEWVMFGKGEMFLTEDQQNFVANKSEIESLKIALAEKEEKIKILEAQIEVLIRTIQGKTDGLEKSDSTSDSKTVTF